MLHPTIGRIVHYYSYGTPGGEYSSEPRAAIITAVSVMDSTHSEDNESRVSLCVLNPTGMFFNPDVPYSVNHKPGSWSWPPITGRT